MTVEHMIDITPNQDEGVLKEVITKGEGDQFPLPGCMVEIDCHIFVTESIMESIYNYKFVIGRGDLIRAWDIALPTMRKGETADFVCVPEYLVTEGQSLFPPKEVQIFDITLLSFRGENLSPNNDYGIERYHTLVLGKRGRNPIKEDVVDVDLVGRYKKIIFDERDVIFVLNEKNESNVINGIKIALLKFNEGETSRLKIRPKYAFGAINCKELGIPPYATVDYTVKLKSINHFWSLSSQQRLQQAQFFKKEADRCYEAYDYQLALNYHVKIQAYLELDKDLQDDFCKKRNDLLLTSYLKRSEISFVLDHYFDAYCAASNALEMDPDNVEALLYRGKIHSSSFDHDLAAKDLKRCLEIDPANKEAQLLRALYG